MHYGWVVTGASLVVGVTAYGTYFSFTLFYPFWVQEFGWSRTEISGAMSLGLIAYGLFAIPMGWLVDRLGPRITVAAGGVLLGSGTALGCLLTEVWQLYFLYGGITAAGMGAAWAPLVSTVSRWFEARRALAVALASIGGGTGTLVVAPVVTHLILAYGWREAYAVLGMLAGALIVGAAMLLARDPQSRDGSLPYGAAARPSPAVAGPRAAPERSLGQAMRSVEFWNLVAMFGMWWLGGAIVYVQLAPYLIEKGFDIRFAAAAVVAFGVGNGAGKIAIGLAMEWLGGRSAYRLTTALAAVSMAALVPGDSAAGLLLTCGIFGFGFGGATPQITTIAVELFGLRSIGALMGAVLALVGLIGAIGPVVSGRIFDQAGSYAPAYLLGAAVLAASIIPSFFLRRSRGFTSNLG